LHVVGQLLFRLVQLTETEKYTGVCTVHGASSSNWCVP
jgi:hypothetical protein